MAVVKNLLQLGMKSLMKEAIDEAPKKLPAEQIPAYLKGKGVTEDELKFSEVEFPKTGVVTREQLQEAEKVRKDSLGVVTRGEPGPDQTAIDAQFEPMYESVNVSKQERNNYREDIYTFKRDSTAPKAKHHWGEAHEDYIAHARRQDMMIDGKSTRVLLEVQSDTASRIQRDPASVVPMRMLSRLKPESIVANNDIEALHVLATGGKEPATANQTKEYLKSVHYMQKALERGSPFDAEMELRKFEGTKVPDQPWIKTYRKKVIEAQLAQAISDGHTQFAVPISGPATKHLARYGNQKVYEVQVREELKRIAKKQGFEYKEVNTAKQRPMTTAEAIAARNDALKALAKSSFSSRLAQLEAGQKVFFSEDDIKRTFSLAHQDATKVAEAYGINHQLFTEERVGLLDVFNSKVRALEKALTSGSDVEKQNAAGEVLEYLSKDIANAAKHERKLSEEGIVYAVIDTAGKKPAQGMYLYASPVTAAFAAHSAIMAGVAEDKIKERMQAEGADEDEIFNAIRDAKFIEEAKRKGVSEDTIKLFIEKKEPKIQVQRTVNPSRSKQ